MFTFCNILFVDLFALPSCRNLATLFIPKWFEKPTNYIFIRVLLGRNNVQNHFITIRVHTREEKHLPNSHDCVLFESIWTGIAWRGGGILLFLRYFFPYIRLTHYFFLSSSPLGFLFSVSHFGAKRINLRKRFVSAAFFMQFFVIMSAPKCVSIFIINGRN